MYSDVVKQCLEDMYDLASDVQADDSLDEDTQAGVLRVADEAISALEDLKDATKGI